MPKPANRITARILQYPIAPGQPWTDAQTGQPFDGLIQCRFVTRFESDGSVQLLQTQHRVLHRGIHSDHILFHHTVVMGKREAGLSLANRDGTHVRFDGDAPGVHPFCLIRGLVGSRKRPHAEVLASVLTDAGFQLV